MDGAAKLFRGHPDDLENHLAANAALFPHSQLPRGLYASLVHAVFPPGRKVTLPEFRMIYAFLEAKTARGEPLLGRLVGKEAADLSDEWIAQFQCRYVSPGDGDAKLFGSGDAVDACWVIIRGAVSGMRGGAQRRVVQWSEGDVIGLDHVLLGLRQRPVSAFVERVRNASDVFRAAPLLLRIEAQSFDTLSASDLMRFYGGAFAAAKAVAPFGQLQVTQFPSVAPAVEQLEIEDVSAGHVLVARGQPVACAYVVVRGQLHHSTQGTFQAGSMVLADDLLSFEQLASGTVTSPVGASVVQVPLEDMHRSCFRPLINAALGAATLDTERYHLVQLNRRELAPPNAQVVSGSLDAKRRAECDTLVSVGGERAKRRTAIAVLAKDVGIGQSVAKVLRERELDVGIVSGQDFWESHLCSLSQAAVRCGSILRETVRRRL